MKYVELHGWKYRLEEDEEYRTDFGILEAPVVTTYGRIDIDGLITIYANYCWDGGSGPAIDTKTAMIGSLFHDFLYQVMREGLLSKDYKDKSDRLLQKICIENDMWSWRAGWWYWAVKSFAKRSLEPSDKHKIIEV